MSVYAIGPFELDADKFTLRQLGRHVALGPKVVETLLALAEHAGEVCEKPWLLDRIWPDGYIQEANLAQNVYVLRKTFQKAGAANPIQTVGGCGYRLIAPVSGLTPVPQPAAHRHSTVWQRPAVALGAGILMLVMLLLVSSTDMAQRKATNAQLSSDAGKLYKVGRYFWNLRTQDGVERGLGFFVSLIDREPFNPRGYAAAAEANISLGEYCYGGHDPNLYFARANDYATRALELDSHSAEGHAALGFLALRKGDLRRAVTELRSALADDAANSEAHEWYGVALLRNGNREQGRRELEKAHQLAPLSVSTIALLAGVAYADHRYARAIAYARDALELVPTRADAVRIAGQAYEAQAQFRQAVAAFRRYGAVDPYNQPEAAVLLARVHALQHRRALARSELAFATAHVDQVSLSDLMAAVAALGLRAFSPSQGARPKHVRGTPVEIAGTEKYS